MFSVKVVKQDKDGKFNIKTYSAHKTEVGHLPIEEGAERFVLIYCTDKEIYCVSLDKYTQVKVVNENNITVELYADRKG